MWIYLIEGIENHYSHFFFAKQNSLIAIAACTLLKDECRTLAIESKVLPHVISGLYSKQYYVRLAACQCAKSLSRSVSHLRTHLVDAGVAPPLIKVRLT